MILAIKSEWVEEEGEGRGNPELFVVEGAPEILEHYDRMGQPHGPGLAGVSVFVERLMNRVSSGGQAGIVGTAVNMGAPIPGYRRKFKVEVLAKCERDHAPDSALAAYQPRRHYFDFQAIERYAPVDEDGVKWAYTGFCSFWTTFLEDTAPCPNETCKAHCPHCDDPLMPVRLDMFLADLMGRGARAVGLAVASFSANHTAGCHQYYDDYYDTAVKIAERMRGEAAERVKALGAGRYAHFHSDHVAPADRTCQLCGNTSKPVAVVADSGNGDPKTWLLTWDCGNRHYDITKEGAIAPWPFIEGYATPADLAAAGFEVK